MNSSSTPKPDKKSAQKRLLLALIPAAMTAALVLGVFLFRQFRARVAKSDAQLATEGRLPPSPTAETHAREGFDLLLNQKNPVDAQAVFEACVRELPQSDSRFAPGLGRPTFWQACSGGSCAIPFRVQLTSSSTFRGR